MMLVVFIEYRVNKTIFLFVFNEQLDELKLKLKDLRKHLKCQSKQNMRMI